MITYLTGYTPSAHDQATAIIISPDDPIPSVSRVRSHVPGLEHSKLSIDSLGSQSPGHPLALFPLLSPRTWFVGCMYLCTYIHIRTAPAYIPPEWPHPA